MYIQLANKLYLLVCLCLIVQLHCIYILSLGIIATNLAKYVAIYTVHSIIIATSCKGFYLKSSLTSPS